MMDYRLLHALDAVISEQGFEKAAQQLYLTQSAVSRRIQQLELQLGAPVLERSQPPRPTPLGIKLLNHWQQVRQLETALGLEQSSQPLTVRLATNADSLATWLASALAPAATQACTDDLLYELVVVDQSIGLQRMKAGEVMACICDSPQPVAAGLVEPLGAMRYRLVASPTLLARYAYQGLTDLPQLPCLVYDRDDLLQHQFLQRVAGFKPQRIHLCPSSEGFRQAIHAGLGFGLLPDQQLGDALDRGVLVDLTPGHFLDTPLYWHYWQTESPALQALRRRVKAAAQRSLQPCVEPDLQAP